MVEIGPADDVVRRPLHPYAEALLRAIPIADPRRMRVRDLGLAEGEVTSQIDPSAGCAFHPRCTRRLPLCAVEVPATTQIEPDRSAACFLHASAIASA
jgi:oligopeptide/dipeptide ABC transporter ATP-binding protein